MCVCMCVCLCVCVQDYVLWTDADDMNGIHVARMDTERKVRGIIHPNYGVAADLITFDPLLQPDLQCECSHLHLLPAGICIR